MVFFSLVAALSYQRFTSGRCFLMTTHAFSSSKAQDPKNKPKWWTWSDSNRLPPRCKRGALPDELQAQINARLRISIGRAIYLLIPRYRILPYLNGNHTFTTPMAAMATPRGIEPRSSERQSDIIAVIPWSQIQANGRKFHPLCPFPE